MSESPGGGRAKEIFTTHEAARICRVTPMTVIRWIKEGKIPAFKTAGGHRRIVRTDLDRFCQSRGIPFAPEGDATKGRVLVVDPDPAVRDAVAEAAHGIDDRLTVEMASDAFGAGRLLVSFRPHLVFLDQRLPGVDTLELCARLTRDPETSPTAIVILCPSYNPDGDRAFRARGALGCVAKPPTAPAIARMVRTAFRMPEGPGAARAVMVVDGDVRSGRALRKELEGRVPGCKVTLCESAVDALFQMNVERPDVMLLDVDRLGLDPAETIRRIRARLTDQPVSIIAIAPPNREDLRGATMAAGARDFVTKPQVVERVLPYLKPQLPEPAAARQRPATGATPVAPASAVATGGRSRKRRS